VPAVVNAEDTLLEPRAFFRALLLNTRDGPADRVWSENSRDEIFEMDSPTHVQVFGVTIGDQSVSNLLKLPFWSNQEFLPRGLGRFPNLKE
jgi:hypothetical protein